MKLTAAEAAKLGILPAQSLRPGSHEAIVASYSDAMLESVIEDLGKRNLRDQKDHEVRWAAARLSACRHERARRKQAGTWTIDKKPRAKAAR